MLGSAWRPLPAQESALHDTSPLVRGCCGVRATTLRARLDSAPSLDREGNPAALAARDATSSRLLALGLRDDQGTLRRPQEALARTEGTLHAEGVRRLGRWNTAGLVTYVRRRDRDVPWNNSSDAYLGSPYVWADSQGGAWLRDRVALGATIASPEWRRLGGGVRLEYGIGQGARRNGPRPLFRRRVLAVVPGVQWRPSARQHIGVHGRVGWEAEEMEIGGAGSPDDPVVFRLRGLGTFDRTQLISAERALLGRLFGGTVAHAWQGARWAWSTSGSAQLVRDSVRDGIGRPVPAGASRRVRLDGRVALRRRTETGGAQVAGQLTQETARGTDASFGAVNVVDEGQTIAVHLERWRGGALVDAERWWRVSAGLARLARRDVVAETEWQTTAPQIAMAGGTRLGGTGTGGWLVGASAGWRFVADTSWRADRPTRLTPVLVRPDFVVHASPEWQGAAGIGYEWRVGTTRARVHGEWSRRTRVGGASLAAGLRTRDVVQITYSLF